jgi:hypothetical protein
MNIRSSLDYTPNGIGLPNRIFFTGVPGSRWSGISQILETLDGFNTSDRTAEREYSHNQYNGHKGAYFGKGMEFDAILDSDYIDSPWTSKKGCKIVKSHEWSYVLPNIKKTFPRDWIMLVYRSDISSFNWWHEAGGFAIKYPNYKSYGTSLKMLETISEQNNQILNFAYDQNLSWNFFTDEWIYANFGQKISIEKQWKDILVTIVK